MHNDQSQNVTRSHLLPQEFPLPELAQERGDKESPETENGAPEGGIWLVADPKSFRQRRVSQVSIDIHIHDAG